MYRYSALLMILWVMLSGCAHVISESGLKQADRTLEYRALTAQPEQYSGKVVLVGGVVAGVRNSGDLLMLEIVQLDLLKNGVPDEWARSEGRFMAVSSELLDPVVFKPGKLVTIVGEVKGKTVQKLEGADYPYPLISVREIRLFRPSEPFATYPDNPYQSRVGDGRLILSPPGPADGEPRRRY